MTKIRTNNDFLSTGYFEQININEDVYGLVRYSDNGTDAFGKPVKDNNKKFIFAFVNRNPLFPFEVTLKVDDYKEIFKNKSLTSLKSF